MRVDVSKSIYHEAPGARQDFDKAEMKRLRLLLRRLRFLEAQVREHDGSGTGGDMWAAWEVEALEWILTDVGFLDIEEKREG